MKIMIRWSTATTTRGRGRALFHRANQKAASRACLSSAAATVRAEHHDSTTKTTTTSSSSSTDQAACKYPYLFRPLDLGPDIGILPNRALQGSMHSGLEGHSMPRWMLPILEYATGISSKEDNDGHSPDHDLTHMAAFFEQRAKGGVGLMVTGGIAPNREGWAGPFSAQLTNEREMEQHKVVTEAVHSVHVPVGSGNNETGSNTVPARICMQILHTGRYAYHPWAVSASRTKSPISPFPARALSIRGIQRTIRDYVQTAVLAKQAGYDGVEIMGSEGYLLSQFLSPRTNHRTDDYGGTLLNRARMPLEIIRQTRDAVGPDFIIIFRLSLLDLVDQGLSFEESLELAHHVEQAGCTILNTGIGWHESRVPTIATAVPRGAFAFPTAALKKAGVVNIPIVATNRINHPATADDLLRDNTSDMISMARPFLADPELMLKSRQGREDEINTCIACNQACLDHVFVGKISSCLVNPAACHETEFPSEDDVLLPEKDRLEIAVVGAGPAGCAFAITAAKRGHKVTLYDQSDSIGGQFNMAKRVPGKEEFHETLRYFNVMLKKHGVTVKLNTPVTLADMEQAKKVNKWIIATGVDPRDPKIPGQEHPKVLSYVDVLRHKKPVGQKVAVIGAGGIGFDVSEYLLHSTGKDLDATQKQQQPFWEEWGIDTSLKNRGGLTEPKMPHQPEREIYLMQRKKGKLGAGLGKTTGWIHRATLNQSNAVHMMNGVTYERVDENGNLHIKNRDGESVVLEVDNIVICAGQVEKDDLKEQASESLVSVDLDDRVFTIGGAYEAGELDAKRAIDMGTRLAVRIHEPSVVPGKHAFKAPVGVEEKLFSILRKFM